MRINPGHAVRMSKYFLPVLRETPQEAQTLSHRYMLRAGMIRQASAGIYSWLPLGFRVLKKIEQIVREEQDRAGAQELLMPTIQSSEIWKKSGRYEDYGKEMLRVKDRHNREMLYGPTNEELITEIFANDLRSYRDVPKILYHIQWKFRDEVRPRYGVMRGREFYMKDAYSFDISPEAGRLSYNKMFVSYLRSFARMGLKAIPMKADAGPIGGNLSHEFIILAETGESEVFCHSDYIDLDALKDEAEYDGDLQPIIDRWTKRYAATDEIHDEEKFHREVPVNRRVCARGIEIGHIFFFGTKYSEALGAIVDLADGGEKALEMGSYGIGISRLVGGIIEASHDACGIIWPESVAPFHVGLVNLRQGDGACDKVAESIFSKVASLGSDIIYDDRTERAGAKFATMDLIGVPYQVIIGPKVVERNVIEVKNRKTGKSEEMSHDAFFNFLKA